MSENNEPTGGSDPIVQPFVDFWTSYIQEANEATKELLDNFDGQADPKAWQRRWFEAISKSMDAYLRSPVFLQAMKHNTDVVIKAKRQADDMTREMARQANIPTTADISGLFERLHSAEDAILGRLSHIEDRLVALEQRMGEHQETGS